MHEFAEIPSESPRELQSQLLNLFERLPRMDVQEELMMDDEAYGGMLNHRINSEYSELLMEKVAGLIKKAPITDHFRSFITERFSFGKDIGINDEIPELTDEEFFFLDRFNPDNGGIFDSTRAKQLERIALSTSVLRTLREEEMLAEIHSLLGQSEGSPQRIKMTYQGRWEALESWKSQFKVVHSEEL